MSRVRKVAGVGASLLAFAYILMPGNRPSDLFRRSSGDTTSNQGDMYCIENGEHAGKKIPAGSPQAKIDAHVSKLDKYRRDHPTKIDK